MTIITKILSASTAIALLASITAYSGTAIASSHGGGQGMKKGMGKGMIKRFAMVDSNGDQKIDAAEMMEWRGSVFAAMDADDNNELTMEEYMAIRMGSGEGKNPEKQKMKQDEKRARFKPMDTDGSGKVSEAEWTKAGTAEIAAVDTDGDGAISMMEFRNHHKKH